MIPDWGCKKLWSSNSLVDIDIVSSPYFDFGLNFCCDGENGATGKLKFWSNNNECWRVGVQSLCEEMNVNPYYFI